MALCREIVRRGHAIENHSQTHGYGFALQGPRGFLRELRTAQQTLAAITGRGCVETPDARIWRGARLKALHWLRELIQ
ncbi:MAG: polysaccharide deacetylase family protein [Rhodoferax sp.]